MLAQKLLSGGAGEEKLYVDDVFQAFTRTGTGADVTVTTGIDMTKGYMLWSKGRSDATAHAIYDSVRGVTADFDITNSTQTTQSTGLKAVSSTGHTIGSLAKMNTSAATYVDWVFRKAPKFFDVVTWSGNSVYRALSHNLGVIPGLIVVKRINTAATAMPVQYRGWSTSFMSLTSDATVLSTTGMFTALPSAANFYVGSDSDVNQNSSTYIAYLFAHDPSPDGIIQCGTYVGNGSVTGPIVTLGWEPQYLMIKNVNGTGDWHVLDSMRGLLVGNSGANLLANIHNAETAVEYASPTATGFQIKSTSSEVNTSSSQYIYMAIRRPNKPPTVGTQVYKGLLHSATKLQVSKTGVGFAPDVLLSSARSQSHGNAIQDRLRGATRNLLTHSSSAEVTTTQAVLSFDIDGVTLGSDDLHQFNYGGTYVEHFFKRAPGVMTQICYSGSGANKTEAHDLTVPPEFWIVKGRSGSTQWVIGSSLLTSTEKIVMPTPSGKVTDSTVWHSTYPTSSVISLGPAAAATYSCWMWATKPGISKVFSYTGNGSSQNIDCGFTTGARFILIVRTSAAGSVYVWDSVRGIISGNDPYLALDTTATEVTTDDSVDPLSYGFSVNQVAASNINVTSATYIGIAYS